jgi:drug/metabolite transporter (DMT)-like permease
MVQVIAAVLSSLFLNISPVLQSIDARTSSDALSFRPGLLAHLVRRPVWLVGSLLGAVAVGLELFALTRLPLSFVQPLLAGGILVMPLASRLLLRESLSVRWFAASILIVSGVIILGRALPASSMDADAPGEPFLVFLTASAVVLYLVLREIRNPALLSLIAGACYGGSAIWLKVLAVSFSPWQIATLAPALAGFAAVGFLAEMTALQRSPATSVAPPILALTTVLPVLAGHIVLGEPWPHPAVTILGFALTVIPALWLAAHFSPLVESAAPSRTPAGHPAGA